MRTNDGQCETAQPKQDLPTVRVHAMTIGLAPDQEPTEWYACCTDQVWLYPGNRAATGGHYRSCNWYGGYRDSRRDAETDAARHRRAHRSAYMLGTPKDEARA